MMGQNSGDTSKSGQRLICSGGGIKALTGLKIQQNHGQHFFGSKEGVSGVGFGNFGEIGPLNGNLEPRNATWLCKADLLFVDSPVGTGFSYTEDESLMVKTDYEAAADMTTLLMELFNKNETLQRSPLYIFAESYGGKFAVTLGLTVLESIDAGKLKLQLGGVALGDSWISPEDFMLSWGPLLKDVSRIDNNGLNSANSLALKAQKQIAEGKFKDAADTWSELEDAIGESSNYVSFYNFMLDEGSNLVARRKSTARPIGLVRNVFADYVTGSKGLISGLSSLMNGPIKKKLKIIPENLSWQSFSDPVFSALNGDFMKPRIEEVDKLLAKAINVTIYNGQLDLICATKGVEAWINKLKWDGLKNFMLEDRRPLYCGLDASVTKGFAASYQNLFLYWILGAGHMVPIDQPCVSLEMVGRVTQSPSAF
ncbi:hypothetical protein CDL15_Pgr025519 [Punica granatum]|uniref:Carboxypeptidase n=1 Tax=Punica granatum TaxID=22663 RepID=A0A218WBF2_PUNGR|nr:hypothetical protein CDL15_Pgr025519 [Punica granatum]